MSPALPVISGTQMVRALEKAGFRLVGQRGSHAKMRLHLSHEVRTVIIPMHHEPGTLRTILRQAGITAEEQLRLL